MTASLLVACLLALVVLALPTATGALLGRRLGWGGAACAATGSAVLGGVSGLLIVLAWGAPIAVIPCALVVVVGSAVAAVACRRSWRLLVVPAALSAGALLFSAGLMLLWGVRDTAFSTAEQRLPSGQLPLDDRIPADLADWFSSSARPHFVQGDWLPSDRPPLQTGLIVLVRAVLGPLAPLLHLEAADLDWTTGAAAQVLWVPACLALIGVIGIGPRVAAAATAVTAVTPFAFVNTVFTWPKLLSAAFVLVALAVLVETIRRRGPVVRGLVLAAACTTFAMLSHGGAVFVVPLVVALAVVAVVRSRGRRPAAAVIGAIAVTGLLWAPWFAFQRWVAPPGDRLLKWHLAGVVDIDDRSFVRALVDQYSTTPLGEIVSARLQNLRLAFDPSLAWADLGISDRAVAVQRAIDEFFHTPAALGLGYPLAAGVLVAWVVRRARRRPDAITSRAAALVAGSVGCVALWCAVMFTAGSAVVHQGSLGWLLILFAVPFALLVRWSRAAGVVAAALTLADTLIVWGPPVDAAPDLHAVPAVVVVVGAASLGAAVWMAGRLHRDVTAAVHEVDLAAERVS